MHRTRLEKISSLGLTVVVLRDMLKVLSGCYAPVKRFIYMYEVLRTSLPVFSLRFVSGRGAARLCAMYLRGPWATLPQCLSDVIHRSQDKQPTK